ncbi:MAG: hypothetical protein IPH88_00800 [Bacteroidales bacterium]|nr:hypothetical protein [Bacteroidales bacterium]
MKTLMIITIAMVLYIATTAMESVKNNYVISGDEMLLCEKVNIGKDNTRLFRQGKLWLKMSTSAVDAYCQNGKYFEKMPVVNKNQDTAGWAFMERIAGRENLNLYRYCSNCAHYDPLTEEIAPQNLIYRYFIFSGKKFVKVINENEVKDQLAYFGVRQMI